MYDDLEKERNQQERNIENYKEKIRILEINIQNYMDKVSEIEEYLLNNQSTENMQKDFRRLQVLRKTQEQACITNYKTFVNEFSDKGYMLLAKPMVDAAMKMVKSVAGERRDIPYMRQASIDHIIKSGTCICGTKIRPGTKEFDALMEQRNFLPPADIGSLLGEFERNGNRWENRSSSLKQDLHEMAEKVDMSIEEYQETLNIIAKIETKMDEQIDFTEKRNKLRYYKQEIQKMSSERGSYLGRIDESQASIERLENQMKSQEAQSQENEKWRKRVEIAEQLYEKLKKDFTEKEKKTFVELNTKIQDNFQRMFNAKDKKIELTPQYVIEMLYKTEIGYREEKNLSEGEKIARNFAFVVTIMEYSREKKAEKSGQESDTLPLVLDGPFSKLGDENIRLIAQVLPKAAEQVIIFMLDKDWKYTGLDAYVGSSYYIEKNAAQTYATIKRREL